MYRKINVLICDDSDDDTYLFKRAFSKAGVDCPIQAVAGGEAAIAYLSGQGSFHDRQEFPLPHLIFMDIKMPETDGFAVLQWLRRQPKLGMIPVIMFSSSNAPGDIDRAHQFGANGFNVKPVDGDGYAAFVHGVESYWLKQHRYPSAC